MLTKLIQWHKFVLIRIAIDDTSEETTDAVDAADYGDDADADNLAAEMERFKMGTSF